MVWYWRSVGKAATRRLSRAARSTQPARSLLRQQCGTACNTVQKEPVRESAHTWPYGSAVGPSCSTRLPYVTMTCLIAGWGGVVGVVGVEELRDWARLGEVCDYELVDRQGE